MGWTCNRLHCRPGFRISSSTLRELSSNIVGWAGKLIKRPIRSKWVVYVEAEPNVAWAYAATVVDTAKGIHAKVVLLDLNHGTCR